MRKLLNFFFLLLAAFMLIVLLKITHGYFLFAIIISFLCLACPVIILFSSQSIIEEKNKIDMQKSHELPLAFDQKKVFRSYIGTLFLFWLLPSAVFLLPYKTWILIGPPIWLASFAIIKLTEHTWLNFGWKKQMYWCLQGVITTLLFTLTMILKITFE